MQIVLDIPTIFEREFNKDKFKDSLERIECDIRDDINEGHTIPTVSGLWELELIDMLIEAFQNAEPIKYTEWELKNHLGLDILYCPQCKREINANKYGEYYKTNFKLCPYCGTRMDNN